MKQNEFRKYEIHEINSQKVLRDTLHYIMEDATLIKKHKLDVKDFKCENGCIADVFKIAKAINDRGFDTISDGNLNGYISEITYLKREDKNDIVKVINAINSNCSYSLDYCIDAIKKFRILRKYNDLRIDISEFIYDDDTEVDLDILDKRRLNFESYTASGLNRYLKEKLINSINEVEKQNHELDEDDFCDIYEIPGCNDERVPIIQNFMFENTFNSVIAPAKAGKSQFSYQMAFCIQNGIPFLGNEVVKADVLYADFELRPNAIKNRFDMLKEHYNMPDAERFKVMSLASKEFSLDEVIRKTRKQIEMNPKIKLVVFDCFYTFSEGDGNKEEDVKNTLHKLKSLTDLVTVNYVHHTNKTGFNNTSDAIYAAGGSGVHGKIVDETYLIKKNSSGEVTVIATGRDMTNEEYPVFMSKDTDWFFELDGASDRAQRAQEEKKKHDPDFLKEKYPEICKFIEENSSDEFGVNINMLNKALNEKYTVSQLKKMGFCASGKNKEEAKGKPTFRVWIPVKIGVTR